MQYTLVLKFHLLNTLQFPSLIVCRFKLPLTWNGQTVESEIYWFENESDPALNSNAYDIARAVVAKEFPGDFGSEHLVQSAVNVIIKSTSKKSTDPPVASCFPTGSRDRSASEAKEGHSKEEDSKDAGQSGSYLLHT